MVSLVYSSRAFFYFGLHVLCRTIQNHSHVYVTPNFLSLRSRSPVGSCPAFASINRSPSEDFLVSCLVLNQRTLSKLKYFCHEEVVAVEMFYMSLRQTAICVFFPLFVSLLFFSFAGQHAKFSTKC